MRITGAVLERSGAAAPFSGSRPFTVGDLELDPPGAGELLVRIEAAGVCHSDLSVVDGSRVRPMPMLLGHEAAGIVEVVGDGVTDVALGDRVVMTFLPRCGGCAGCAADGRLPCEVGTAANNAGTLVGGGIRLHRTAGGASQRVHHHLGVSAFASHAVVSRTSIVPVDADVPPEVAALLGCAVLTGGGAVINAGRPAPGAPVIVVGLGGVGMAALLVAVALGHEVIGVDAVAAKLDLARELGAADAFGPADAAERGIRAPVVIEAAGSARAFETAVELTSAGGTTVTVGLPAPDARASVSPLLPDGRSAHHRGQLSRVRRAEPRHPSVRRAVARGTAAARTAGLLPHPSRRPRRRHGPARGRRRTPAADHVLTRRELLMTRIAIVTGAARGIGAATAKRLAADGNAVAVLDLDEAQCAATVSAIADAGGRAIAVGANVADASAVADAVARVEAELGAPTILVNNAGIIRDNLLFKMTEDDWDSVLSVHLRGAFLMSRAVQTHQVNAGWGRIVNLSSTSALGNRGQANYAAAKAGMQGLTKTLAIELGRYGVTANAVAPGFIVTDMTRQTAERIGVGMDEFIAAQAAEVPVGRAGNPEDIAAAVSFFCSEEAGFVSGQVLYVAGGPRA